MIYIVHIQHTCKGTSIFISVIFSICSLKQIAKTCHYYIDVNNQYTNKQSENNIHKLSFVHNLIRKAHFTAESIHA